MVNDQSLDRFIRHGGSGNIRIMSATLEDITKDALKLSREQRLALAGFLLEVDEAVGDPEIEKAWEREILARIRAIDEGKVAGVPYEEVMCAANELLSR
jgi:putative addiction module component (TIGR02574 family)